MGYEEETETETKTVPIHELLKAVRRDNWERDQAMRADDFGRRNAGGADGFKGPSDYQRKPKHHGGSFPGAHWMTDEVMEDLEDA